MPSLSCDELMHHSFVVRILDKQKVDPSWFIQNSAQSVDAALPLLESCRVPFKVKVNEMEAESMQVNSL